MNKMTQREKIEGFERVFESLHLCAITQLDAFPEHQLFTKVALDNGTAESTSFAFELLRSVAEIEKAFGGLTARLWDDPFEWTLGEELSSKSRIGDYINEVKTTRIYGLEFFRDDDDLKRLVPAPENLRSISEILLQTIEKAEYHLKRASKLSLQSTGFQS